MDKTVYRKELKTPCYIFDVKALRERAERLKEKGEAKGISLCYAIKANPFLTPCLSDYVESFEVCSHGELKICKAQGIDMGKIVLSGVNKEREFIEDGILSGVKIMTAESAGQFEMIEERARAHKRHVQVILRLSCGAQFGMDKERAEQIIKEREAYPYVSLAGLHFFSGTQKKKVKKMMDELCMLEEFAGRLKQEYGFSTKLLEYGPGLSVPYFIDDDFQKDMEDFDELLAYIERRQYPFQVVLEMGRFFVSSCGVYVTGVADCKINEGMPVCIIDGGKNHLSYYGQNMALKTPVIEHLKGEETGEKEGCEQEWMIFGSLCSFHDIIARNVALKDLRAGDRLVFYHVGAYSVTEGMYLFLSRPMPDIYLDTQEGLVRVREKTETCQFNGGTVI